MNATETSNTPVRAAAAGTHAGAGAGTAGSDAPSDAFAALLQEMSPLETGNGAAVDTAATATSAEEASATPAKRGKTAPAADTLLPEAFLLQVPPGPGVPLAAATATDLAGSPSDTASRQGVAGGKAAAASFLPAANDPSLVAGDAQPARSGGFQALMAAATAATTAAEPAPRLEAPAAVADAAALPLGAVLPSAQGMPALDTAGAAIPIHQATLPSHPQSPAFAGDLGAEVRWMVEAGLQQAELHLNPAELGPIQVQLSLTAQTAEIHFAAVHGATRESIQQALPVLRDMLANQGLQLGQAGVSGGDAGQGFAQAEGQTQQRVARTGGEALAGSNEAPRAVTGTTLRAGRGMLDLYA